MNGAANSNPLVSITLPLATDADPELLEICLNSIRAQTYRVFEVLVLVSEGSSAALARIISRYSFTRSFTGEFSKSAARNFLADRARGEYILYIDVDMELDRNLLRDCVEVAAAKGSLAIVTGQKEAPGSSFWTKCRELEWILLEDDIGSGSPFFMKKSVLENAGGFDEDLDMWDDWVLTLRLMEQGIEFDRVKTPVLIRDTTDLSEMFLRKYRRGRFITALLEKFPNAPHVRFRERFIWIYARNWRALARSPLLAAGLAVLKIVDALGLLVGRLRPISKAPEDGTKPYFLEETAQSYDRVRLQDQYNLYKHYSEVQSLLKLLGESDGALVEVGAGTGRITRELIAKRGRIVPTDPSPAMLVEYRRKPRLPLPIRADGTALPFATRSFVGAFSLRVIWHLPSRRGFMRMLSEMARVSSEFVIVDIANERRWRHPLLRPLAAVYFMLNPTESRRHQTTQLLSLEAFNELAGRIGLRVEETIPLETLPPIWLRFLPAKLGRSLHSLHLRFETTLSKGVPPGRYLLRLSKNSNSPTSLEQSGPPYGTL